MFGQFIPRPLHIVFTIWEFAVFSPLNSFNPISVFFFTIIAIIILFIVLSIHTSQFFAIKLSGLCTHLVAYLVYDE